MSKQSLIKEGR